jgi:uncharacterized membrane protein YeaQ/YmgE (transglycosylase-associated protein family)
MGLCGWIVFGFFAGLIARALMPGKQGLGIIATTLLGIGGAFVGGFLASFLFGGYWREPRPSGFLGAILGSMVLLFLGELFFKKR